MFYNVYSNLTEEKIEWYESEKEAAERAHELNVENNTDCGGDEGFQVIGDNNVFYNDILFEIEGWK